MEGGPGARVVLSRRRGRLRLRAPDPPGLRGGRVCPAGRAGPGARLPAHAPRRRPRTRGGGLRGGGREVARGGGRGVLFPSTISARTPTARWWRAARPSPGKRGSTRWRAWGGGSSMDCQGDRLRPHQRGDDGRLPRLRQGRAAAPSHSRLDSSESGNMTIMGRTERHW